MSKTKAKVGNWRERKLLVTRKTYVVGKNENVDVVPLKEFFRATEEHNENKELGETSAVIDEVVHDSRRDEDVMLVEESHPLNLHEQRKEKARNEWIEVQPVMTLAYIAGQASFMDMECALCTQEATLTCLDCGPFAFFCEECSKKLHSTLLHKPMARKGQLVEDDQTRILRQSHTCQTSYGKTLEVFDSKGRLHNVLCTFCKCEPEAATLVRYSLWPTQLNPRKAVSMELMTFIHYMQVEAHVSLKAACQVIGFQNRLSEREVNALYSELIQYSFSHFQAFYTNVDAKIVPEYECNHSCPACPKVTGQVIVCIDGCFGLVRRKKAGSSAGGTTHQTTFFVEDDYVKTFVDGYRIEHGQASKNCSQFKAGTLLRTKKKADALDVKGVFGAVCRHGFPLAMLNMFQGESLAYSVCMIEHLKATLPEGITMHVAYDIACQLTAHLKKTGQAKLLEEIKLVLPAFHAYGHKASCQREFNVRNTKDMGLTDGEATERLWAYLRRFSAITKEMTPIGRQDKLTSALLHFAYRKQRQMATGLCTVLKRAKETHEKCQKEFLDLSIEYGITENDVEQWLETRVAEERQTRNISNTDHKKWQHGYCEKVAHYEDTRCDMANAKTDEAARDLRQELARIDSRLLKMERKHGVPKRWTTSDSIYVEFITEVHDEERKRLLIETRRQAMDKIYLGELMRKYGRGQAIANRLKRQSWKVNTQMKEKLKKYNQKWNKRGFFLSFEQVAQPDDAIYNQHLLPACEKPGIPTVMFERADSLLKRIQRSYEEVNMTKLEMKQMIMWQEQQEQLLLDRIGNLCLTDKYDMGLSIILWGKVKELRQRTSSCRALFSDYL
ncbi:uncharacterized protein LOC121428660 isoform X2 [Lytechinus variegatus]|uniref:uncharacterized protein LOC121428660 isoform X2 n=1 Tax=Lytechinus variegatus TaxID=7654 RepID=UPI001BB26378|nr:uncharacterized protein LOC121428660 isoform X2 [Lytechinus variegatus]